MTLDVHALVRQAAEAAKLAPEHLQEAAFTKAFEALVQAEGKPSARGTSKPEAPAPGADTAGKTGDRAALIERLDRTAHPEISHDRGALDNALLVLRAVRDDLGLDGLSATEVSSLLNDKFRCNVSRRGIARALNDAGRYVDRRKEGSSVIFRLMGPGEDYLNAGRASAEGSRSSSSPRRRPRKRGSPAKKESRAGTPAKKGRVGAATAMDSLLEKGFFSEPRKIGDIIETLKHDRGRSFKANELSPVLVRWLRSDKLTRSRNADGQYEYVSA